MNPQAQQQEYSKPQANQPYPNPRLFSLPNKYIAVLIIILCLASLGSAIYFLVLHNKDAELRNGFLPQNIITSPSPTPTPQELPKDIEETSNWNIYSNSQYRYSIKYPLDWNGVITPQGDPKILEYVVFNPLSATKAGELSITLTYTTRSYKEVLDSDPQPGESIAVASVTATRKLKQDSQHNIFISVAIPFGGVANTLILYGKETHKDIFNQMLSTLNLSP